MHDRAGTRPAAMLALDFKYAFRAVGRRRGFAAAAILTIALGVGANSAVFSLVYSVLARPLPFTAPERLVYISQTSPNLEPTQTSYLDFVDWRAGAASPQNQDKMSV